MSKKLDGKVAVITGSTRSIGRAIAEDFLAEGASVVLSGRSREKGALALKELDAGDRAHFVVSDALEQDQVENLVDESVKHFGAVDILVNNTGGCDGFALIHELSDTAWNRAIDWTLNSAFWATRRALPGMLERGWGRVICISSVEGKRASQPAIGHYITSKHALNGFVKAVAVEYGAQGVTANAICPGAVETDSMAVAGRQAAEAAGISYEQFLAQYAGQAMTGKLNTVDEVAAVATLLASDAGAGMTGGLINVDGGTSPW
ncbi:SDR family NAD(P)-dependent oxidoreductase [Nocardioides bizhenqiangii]|uniref:SDR family NAD(P)-dependent oxidoreductase n=1 Tax=Nocardioides bizhenqiangii TaxID=3095076 RepID=A0ABZ0ZNN8_9ACTN|nr:MULTISPECIES: SDR family NAD(P)-dependent oxidoreductase [unclassified Nocardioides]MDZ5621038.1 SDR family NAD(P)-dependent oxidoreductase [Nocardioides sp. HM23]WQQ25394.1 SDR family NAD(P)-dependent oxidoreductase [Nocardioides sp. HM61]